MCRAAATPRRACNAQMRRLDLPAARRRDASTGSGVGVAALEVALELAGDRLAAGLGELGGVLALLEVADVLGDVLVLLGQLGDAPLPGAALLGQVAERDAGLQQVLDLAEQREGGLGAGRLGQVVGDRGPE